MMYRIGVFLLFIFQSSFGFSQSAHKYLLDGNSKFLNEQYGAAELDYRKALEQEESLKAKYNLGGSVYQQQRFEEAAEQFNGAIAAAKSDLEKGSAYYNLGNSLLKAEKIEESIGAYKEALKYLPEDQATWNNLANAQFRKMQQQQQQQQNQDGDEEQNEEEQEQEQQEGNEDEQQEQEQQSQGGEPQESEAEDREEEAEEAKENIDLEDALKLLQAIENEDQKVQEKMRKRSGSKKKPVKDW